MRLCRFGENRLGVVETTTYVTLPPPSTNCLPTVIRYRLATC